MRPKDYIEDITTLTNTLTQTMTYRQGGMEEHLEYLDEYVEFISEFLTEFRHNRVYVTPLPHMRIYHPEGWRRHLVDTPHNIAYTPPSRTVASETQFMGSFETLKHSVIRELNLNKEVFIYNILPYRHMDSDGEIRYRPAIRWCRLPLDMWYNDVPPTDPFMGLKMVKKHKL